MSVDLPSTEQNDATRDGAAAATTHANSSPTADTEAPATVTSTASPRVNQDAGDGKEQDDDEEEDEEEEEPKLKYAKLTGSLTNVYRNGDSTSACSVAGDKMLLGTHNGNIHVLRLPTLHSLRTYHAHSATITSISVSPTPPPPSYPTAASHKPVDTTSLRLTSTKPTSTTSTSTPPRTQPAIPNTPANQIYIATSSLDGHICITSLLDPKDVQLRNFARPVNAVALSPAYRTDRTYLSGGRAGQLILTVGGKIGGTVDANTNSNASATSGAGGFLGALGLGGDRGKDTVLHSGEGAISAISWSRSSKWVCWVNEEGIKIMRSHLKLGSEDEEDAWRRVAHAERPMRRRVWEEMVGVWKGRVEWVDERWMEADEEEVVSEDRAVIGNGTPEKKERSSEEKGRKTKRKMERLVVGWGDMAWIMHVTEAAPNARDASGKKIVGTVEIPHKLHFVDCVVSGIAFYTPSLLAVLAYRTRDDNDKPIQQPPKEKSNAKDSTKKGRFHHPQTGVPPQLRLIKINGEEDSIDELSISRFETLSAQDYHLGTLFIPPPPPASSKDHPPAEKGALEGLWENTRSATRLFSSSASVLSSRSSEGKSIETNGGLAGKGGASITSPGSSAVGVPVLPASRTVPTDAHPYAAASGLKLFIQSPYDCVLAVKRDLKDHLQFLLEAQDYKRAWELVDRHPGVVDAGSTTASATTGAVGTERTQEQRPSTPARQPTSTDTNDNNATTTLADFFADDETASQHSTTTLTSSTPAARREKSRIADLWLHQLLSTTPPQWSAAGAVAAKVLPSRSERWDHWILEFARAGEFDEIVPHIPGDARLSAVVYEVVLGHYVRVDPARARELMELRGTGWEAESGAWDVGAVRAVVESRLEEGEFEEEGEEWKVLVEVLALLLLAQGRAREAVRCYIRVQNAEKVMELLREEKGMEGVLAENVPGLLMLRVSREQMRSAPLDELAEASKEVVALLVDEALRHTLPPKTVIRELEKQGRPYRPFLFFYLRALWQGQGSSSSDPTSQPPAARRRKFAPAPKAFNSGAELLEDHADLALELFADYDRPLLLPFLHASETYSYERASAILESRHYIRELVYVLSKSGGEQARRALFLIIDELADVGMAIAFAKDNPDLWEDLLEYCLDKPAFIRGLLEEVGTAVEPVRLVRRIPEGLVIEGLREGIARMLREYDVQVSLSEGVARVLRGEVAGGMDVLRAGRKRGVKFEVVREGEVGTTEAPVKNEGAEVTSSQSKSESGAARKIEPGRCVGCGEVFGEDEKEILIGFACGHVYHLSCLLKSNPETADDPKILSDLQSQIGLGDSSAPNFADAAADEGYVGRSVGAKVAHAHIIKNVLKGGCRFCGEGDADARGG